MRLINSVVNYIDRGSRVKRPPVPLPVSLVRIASSGLLVSIVSLALAAPVAAQSGTETRRYASGTAGASFGDGKTAPAFSAALGFEVTRRLAVEFDLAYARKLDFVLDLCPTPLVCVIGGQVPVTGRTVALTTNLMVDLPSAWRRVRPYVLGGVGAGHLRQRYFPGGATGSEGPELTRSKMALAFSVGGGAEVQITRRLAVGADVRWAHLLDEEATPDRFIVPAGTISTLRAGSRVSWRF
jgi:opacity protein-like surface antigen